MSAYFVYPSAVLACSEEFLFFTTLTFTYWIVTALHTTAPPSQPNFHDKCYQKPKDGRFELRNSNALGKDIHLTEFYKFFLLAIIMPWPKYHHFVVRQSSV